MASTRTRNGRIIGLFRDAQGRQKSAGTWPTQAEALKAAKHAEALANPPEMTLIYPSEKRGKVTVAGYLPGWLEGHRLEDSSREGYQTALTTSSGKSAPGRWRNSNRPTSARSSASWRRASSPRARSGMSAPC